MLPALEVTFSFLLFLSSSLFVKYAAKNH